MLSSLTGPESVECVNVFVCYFVSDTSCGASICELLCPRCNFSAEVSGSQLPWIPPSVAAWRSHRLPRSCAVLKTEAWPAGCRDCTFGRFWRVRSISADTIGKCCSWIRLLLPPDRRTVSRWPADLEAGAARREAAPRAELDSIFLWGGGESSSSADGSPDGIVLSSESSVTPSSLPLLSS